MLEAPTTTARRPRSGILYSSASRITPERRAGTQPRTLLREQARVGGMKSIHVLGRIHRIHDSIGVHALRQRQLHENAVDALIAIELLDEREQIRFAGGRGQIVREGQDARLLARLALVAHVDGGRRILAHLHHRKAGRAPVSFLKLTGALCSLDALARSERLAVQQDHRDQYR